MLSGILALLKYSVLYMNVKQGSSPDRGQSPVEWGDFPFIRPSIHPFPPLGHPARPEAQPARPKAEPAWPETQLARPEAQSASHILHDFVPYRGCCPASPKKTKKISFKKK